MAIYELRTYTLYTGKMAEAVEAYSTLGWPALSKYEGKLIGYFTGDVGAMNKIVHLWKFEDDADRRAFWNTLFADEDFKKFAAKFRPLVLTQENQLMMAAPWGPHP
ncbi:MAG: NIPSNAP family protein [Rhodospirillaceae bacterium]|nr:NIPSNAP family protein [Rhodospirillaceae bacterium]|tara:strand:+ start:264 stop:581 length:318 start_codon:yes stop_codon:yes gene_type:complete